MIPTTATADIGGHRPRRVSRHAKAETVAQVADAVRAAAADGTTLYPVSTGRNWGLGSWFPVRDDATLLDLSSMDRIHSVNLQGGYAVIEPGVTQRALAQRLAGTPWMLNTTSSCADTSIVGNALERGDGMIRSRRFDVLAVQAVLPTGEFVATGGMTSSGVYHGCVAGPDLTGLFVQSNLGVVTLMAVSLLPRPEAIRFVQARYPVSTLPAVARRIIDLHRAGLPEAGMMRLRGRWLVPSRGGHLLPPGADPDTFVVATPILGRPEVAELIASLIVRELGEVEGCEAVRCVDALTVREDDPLYPRALQSRGEPNCLSAQRGLARADCHFDEGDIGWLTFLPLVPLDPGCMAQAVDLVGETADAHQTAAMAEFNLVDAHMANMVVQMSFHREPESAKRAHALREALRFRFAEHGWHPYRSNIDHMPSELVLSGAASAGGNLLPGIKDLCDPVGLLAPGRYVPAPLPHALG